MITEQEKLIVTNLNRLISEAWLDGGDWGGGYYCNRENLELQLKQVLDVLGLSDNWCVGVKAYDANGHVIADIEKVAEHYFGEHFYGSALIVPKFAL